VQNSLQSTFGANNGGGSSRKNSFPLSDRMSQNGFYSAESVQKGRRIQKFTPTAGSAFTPYTKSPQLASEYGSRAHSMAPAMDTRGKSSGFGAVSAKTHSVKKPMIAEVFNISHKVTTHSSVQSVDAQEFNSRFRKNMYSAHLPDPQEDIPSFSGILTNVHSAASRLLNAGFRSVQPVDKRPTDPSLTGMRSKTLSQQLKQSGKSLVAVEKLTRNKDEQSLEEALEDIEITGDEDDDYFGTDQNLNLNNRLSTKDNQNARNSAKDPNRLAIN